MNKKGALRRAPITWIERLRQRVMQATGKKVYGKSLGASH